MRKINSAGLDLVKRYEGCSLHAYLCPAGVPTIGYGWTRDVKLGMTITQHQADVVLEYGLEEVAEDLEKVLKGVTVSDNAFSALCSFVYNVGIAAFSNSTMLKKLRKGDMDGAAAEFARWNKGGGRVLPGLVKRRAAEAALFKTP